MDRTKKIISLALNMKEETAEKEPNEIIQTDNGFEKAREWVEKSQFNHSTEVDLCEHNIIPPNKKIKLLSNILILPWEINDAGPLNDQKVDTAVNSSTKLEPPLKEKDIPNLKISEDENAYFIEEIPCDSETRTEIISASVSDDSKDKDYVLTYDEGNESSQPSDIISAVSESIILATVDKINFQNKQCTQKPTNELPLAEILYDTKKKKMIRCKFCNADIFNKNFSRHLQRKHGDKKDVENIFAYPKKSKERKQAVSLLKNETNFNLYIQGDTRPYRKYSDNLNDLTYYPCAYCKGLFLKRYLRRHAKSCTTQKAINLIKDGKSQISLSHTLTACAMDPTNVISKLNVKEQVFDIMKGDKIALEAKKDLLISHFGDSYLKKHKREGIIYACSNRMRELSRLLIEFRMVVSSDNLPFKDILHPKNFDNVLAAARITVGYDPIKKTFKSPSLAMHLGTSLKIISEELIHLVLKESNGFQCDSEASKRLWIDQIKDFKSLVESRWNTELASLASKDLQEKKWNKPLLLPLVNDIKIFREKVMQISNECCEAFQQNLDTKKTYKSLVQCTLSLLIIFNRRRIGDVQFLKITDYQNIRETNFPDFQNALTETEKILTKRYKRILNSGKGSRAIVILLPEILEKYINILINNRFKYIPDDNEYVFAMPDSKIKWGKGDVAIRNLSKNMGLKNPELISSNKLRKHISTVMQILNLTKEETKQFSSFMGHTEKTHNEYYELPIDIYQTAKVSKFLLMMEKGTLPLEYKGKSLSEINIDIEYPEEYESGGAEEVQEASDQDQEAGRIAETKDDKTTNVTDVDNDLAGNIEDVAEMRKKPILKRSWTNNEIKNLQKEFASYIDSETYPSSKEIQAFIEKYRLKRSAPQLKSKLQHLIKLKNR